MIIALAVFFHTMSNAQSAAVTAQTDSVPALVQTDSIELIEVLSEFRFAQEDILAILETRMRANAHICVVARSAYVQWSRAQEPDETEDTIAELRRSAVQATTLLQEDRKTYRLTHEKRLEALLKLQDHVAGFVVAADDYDHTPPSYDVIFTRMRTGVTFPPEIDACK